MGYNGHMEVHYVKISDLIPATYNPRQISEKQFSDLKKSIEKFGFVDPIVANSHKNRKNIVIGGHMRLKAAEALRLVTVPVVYFNLSEELEKELNVRLNKNTGEFDFEALANEFEVSDLVDWGFDEVELLGFDVDVLEPEETEGDDNVPESAPDITVLGDIYELGGVHRVMCGDSLSSDAVERLMDGQKAVLAHNDPPYGMKKEKEGIQNDNLNYDDLLEFNSQWIPLQFTHLEDNGSFYCWGIDEPLMDIYSLILKPLIKTQKATFRNLITWHKDPSGLGDGQNNPGLRKYGGIDEKCLFVMCGVQGFNNNADNYFEVFEPIRKYLDDERIKAGLSKKESDNITGVINDSQHIYTKSQFDGRFLLKYKKLQDYCQQNNIDAFKKEYDEIKKEYDEIKKEYYSTRAYFNNTHDNMTNVWDIARTKGKEREQTGGHATPKPLELCDRVIKSSSPEGAIVTDWFLGSGSTLIACEKINRKCYGMELDPKYCDVIVKRYVTFCKTNNRPYSVFRNGEVCKDFDKED